MPSPVGHVLGGIAIGFLASRERHWRLPLVCGVAAALPDIDFLLPVAHRGPTHSVGAAVIAFAVAWTVSFRCGQSSRWRVAAGVGLGVLSHVLFDWLGKDSSPPRGLMALWPFTDTYYISDLNVFNAVDRRYWQPGFWRRNAIALVRELAILLPLVVLTKGTATFFRKR